MRTPHIGITSSLTPFEAEDALFDEMSRSLKGKRDKRKKAVLGSSGISNQVLLIKQFYKLHMVDLREQEFIEKNRQINLQFNGIEAGDSLHMATAILNNADLVISTDKHMLSLNNNFRNSAGNIIQCLDTDGAKLIL